MHEKLEERRQAIVAERRAMGLGFAGRDALHRTRPGSIPRRTKRSHLGSHRPRVLSVCHKRRAECKAWYFAIYFEYREASERYRAGEVGVEFPHGTFRPHLRVGGVGPPPG